MKVISFIILFCLIIYINTIEKCNSKDNAISSNDCKNLQLTNPEYHCCYYKGSNESGGNKEELNKCVELTKEQYDKIDETIEKAIEDYKKRGVTTTVDSLDCKSFYLVLNLCYLLLLLL